MTDQSPTTFRSLFTDHGTVCVEVGAGEIWYLPQAGEGYRPYDPARVLKAVKAAGVVNLSRWKRLTTGGNAL